jgi:hypothetical protein
VQIFNKISNDFAAAFGTEIKAVNDKFSNYEFRCSALGKIVSKSGKFTDGNKTYVKECFIGEVHKVRKQISNKYFEKGLFEEESGITLLNKTLFNGKLLVKNKERKHNGYIHGEADCIKDGIVFDIKNAWDLFTFGDAELSHDYKWQLVGYMWLWNIDKAALFYCLNNTPEHILIQEEKRLFYSGNYVTTEDSAYISDCEALRAKHNYDSMELYERFKVFPIKRNDEEIEMLQSSVVKAREYMNELYVEYLERLDYNMDLIKNGLSI